MLGNTPPVTGVGTPSASHGLGPQEAPPQSTQTEPVPRTRLSALESLPLELKYKISTYLSAKELAALGETSEAMQELARMPECETRIFLAARVEALLKKPYAERKLGDLVHIGLLPRSALTHPLSARHLAVLLSDNVIRGLHLNTEFDVEAELETFAHILPERMPDVEKGIAQLQHAKRAMFSKENRKPCVTASGKESTVLSEMIKSNVFANALCDETHSAFGAYLREFSAQLRKGDASTVSVATHWARTVHPEIQQIGYPPVPAELGNVGVISEGGLTSLFEAAGSHSAVVNALLKNGANFNLPKDDGQTPLFYATYLRHSDTEETMKLLLKNKVQPSHADNTGQTALHWAAKYLQPYKVDILIENKANVKHRDHRGRNALHNTFARTIDLRKEERGIKVAQSLVKAGIDLFEEDRAGKLPIDYLQQHSPQCKALIQLVEDEMRARQSESV